MYVLFIIGLAMFKPKMLPALPPEALRYREPDGSPGMRSLGVFFAVVAALTATFGMLYGDIVSAYKGSEVTPALDETIVVALSVGTLIAFFAAVINKVLRFGLLSQITERVTFVLIPPLALIFLVLGPIFLGVATPTEGGAMGAVGALLMAVVRRRLDFQTLKRALESTAQLSTFVLFILIGSTLFSFTFIAVDGQIWVEHLFDKLPGGEIGFLLFVNLMVVVLGFFLDFFEIAFILIPLLAPVAEKLDINLIWFGVMLAMNLQTSFLTPPFGFALFYLRSVAPVGSFVDRVTGKRTEGVKTMEIYRGSIPFVIIQLIMLGLLMAFPQLVTFSLDKPVEFDPDTMQLEIPSNFGGGGAWDDDKKDGW
jgi:tripartite ATP-independent transporter DctM subunit